MAKAYQPGRTGNQNVATRYNKTPDKAVPDGIPEAVKPAIRAASTAPIPPGVGAACPIVEPAK